MEPIVTTHQQKNIKGLDETHLPVILSPSIVCRLKQTLTFTEIFYTLTFILLFRNKSQKFILYH